jgi:hypothetical protein
VGHPTSSAKSKNAIGWRQWHGIAGIQLLFNLLKMDPGTGKGNAFHPLVGR